MPLLTLRNLLSIAALCLATFAASPGYAQKDTARAVALVQEANGAYDRGDFRTALAQYREVYDITSDPRVLYRIGLTYENLENYQRAREHLELYLLAEPDSQYAGRVNAKIETLKKLEATLQAAIRVDSTPAGANVWLNDDSGKPVGVTPVRIPVGPGSHTLIVKRDGHTAVREAVAVESSQTLEKAYTLVSDGSPVAAAEPTEDEDASQVATEPAVADPGLPAGTLHRVRVGPSTGLATLCWISVGVGWAITIAGGAATQIGGGSTFGGSGVGLGLALVGVGGYFLWFHDWSRDLPAAQTATLEVPAARVFGVRVPF